MLPDQLLPLAEPQDFLRLLDVANLFEISRVGTRLDTRSLKPLPRIPVGRARVELALVQPQ